MYSSDDPIFEAVGLLLTELRELRSSGPHFRIVHRFREPGCMCTPGEEVAAVYLIHRSREIFVPLSTTLRVLFDFLAKHSYLPQNASQITAVFNTDPFYCNHGANARGDAKFVRKISRSGVKEFVHRIRIALALAFREANMNVNPAAVLRTEPTMTNEVTYRLKGVCEWVHVNRPDRTENDLLGKFRSRLDERY
jgi:hypothetical protein